MLITVVAVLALCFACAVVREEDLPGRSVGGGFAIGNFGICARVSPQGHFLPEILVNPPVEGPWLESIGGGRLTLDLPQARLAAGISSASVERQFPFAEALYTDPSAAGVTLAVRAFSPVADHDALATSLPVVLADIEVLNAGPNAVSAALSFEMNAEVSPPWQLAFGFHQGGGLIRKLPVEVPSGCSFTARLLVALYHPNGYYSRAIGSVEDLVRHSFERWDELAAATEAFSSLLPSVGEPKIDEYLRWYLPSGIYLTRITRDIALTMGYCEFNQRDSFWTSYPHLIYWPDIELRMLEMTALHMRPDGKIPTTILPVIEREDDLDINCYFVIRVWRYYEWTRDRAAALELRPAVEHALDWLASRDEDCDGLLEQQSYWADWKDVNGVEGRKHAPHFEFVWLAALRAGASLASLAEDRSAAERWSVLFQKAFDRTHSLVEAGGLWNGRFYECAWRDGHRDETVQQDQMVGAFLGVIPPDRVPSIIDSLQPSMSPWGVRETWPYRTPFSNEGGDYHNGGIWPFLSFVDAAARAMHGFPEQCEEILKTTGFADLEQFGDWTPHEYLFGDTGENRGPIIQGWNACYLAAVYCGLLGIRIRAAGEVEVALRIPEGRAYSTVVRLPEGALTLQSEGHGKVTVSSELASAARIFFKAMKAGRCRKQEILLLPGCSAEVDA